VYNNHFINAHFYDHRYVVDRLAVTLKEDQVARTGLTEGDFFALSGLLPGNPLDVNTRILVEVKHKAGTIEALTRVIAAIFVLRPQQLLGVIGDIGADKRGRITASGTGDTGRASVRWFKGSAAGEEK